MSDQLFVTTNVARNVLQTAQLFRTPESVIWEYVVNGLQYVNPGVKPEITVRIELRRKRVTITDNGRGMDVEGLRHYFQMHGENLDRRSGRPGRGKFGTGKSAAFGIARRLEITTVRDGKKNCVELLRRDIEASSGGPIPVRWLSALNESVSLSNGTIVVIDDLIIQRVPSEVVVRYIERQLAFWRGVEPMVVVDNLRCEPRYPVSVENHKFQPDDRQAQILGAIRLVIHVAAAPLDPGEYGVAVTTGPGALAAIETAGIEKKEFGSYLFGEVECRKLDDPKYELEPYDTTRNLQLNPQHPYAAALIGFIGASVEKVRATLADEHRRRKQEQQFKQLDLEAAKIAEFLNDDLLSVRDRLAEIKAMSGRKGLVGLAGQVVGGAESDIHAEGDEEPGVLEPMLSPIRVQSSPEGRAAPDLARRGRAEAGGEDRVSRAGGVGAGKKPRGGFIVEYRNLGAEEDRGRYDQANKSILINLDHPMVVAAKGSRGIDDPTFRRVSHEIAFTTYALALAQEFLRRDPEMSGDDVLYECRSALRRIASKAAGLYRESP